MALMKEKGHLNILPLRVLHSNTTHLPTVWHGPVYACWDGEYFWSLMPGEKGPLSVLDPRTENIWTFGPRPVCRPRSLRRRTLGTADCVAGYFGRLWIAVAAFDGSRIALDLIHEAREVPRAMWAGETEKERPDTKVGRPVEYVAAMTAPASEGQRRQQRVLVGRLAASPLLVDLETRSATSLPYIVSYDDFFLCNGDAVLAKQEWPRGISGPASRISNKTRQPGRLSWHLRVFEGQYHIVAPYSRSYYVTRDIKEPSRRLTCDVPGNSSFSKLAVSNHYGLLF